jgi:hypothetical protein
LEEQRSHPTKEWNAQTPMDNFVYLQGKLVQRKLTDIYILIIKFIIKILI